MSIRNRELFVVLFCFLLALFSLFSLSLEANGEANEEDNEKSVVVPAATCYLPINLSQKDSSLETWFTSLQEKQGFSGTVLIAEKGEVVHTGEYGYANRYAKDTLTQMSSFQLASVSKMITATAIMLLHDQGKISFDEEVCTYLQGFPYDGLTIRHLLNHRSGLPRYMAVVAAHWPSDSMLTHKDVVQLYCTHQPNLFFTPGNGFNYNNTNYVLLAAVVEELSGISFADFVEKFIFDPVGMKNSRVVGKPSKDHFKNEVLGYKKRRRGFRKAWNDHIDEVTGDKGIYASSMDILLFDQALHCGKLVRAETLKEAYKNGSPNRRLRHYGFGLRIKPGENQIVYHFGWWRGFRSYYIHDITQERTIIILSNLDNRASAPDFWGLYDLLSTR